MTAAQTPASVPTGNTFDKYGSSHPVVRRLMAGFQRTLDDLLEKSAPASVLDVGCGEGVLTAQWAERLDDARVVGVDLEDPKLTVEWQRRRRANLEFQTVSGEDLPFPDNAFTLVTAIEALEHIAQPERTLEEMARVSSSHLLVSVPREPLWRALNLARGAYVRQLGNTPGHVNHWSTRAFVQLLENYGAVDEVRQPFPWTMLLVRIGS